MEFFVTFRFLNYDIFMEMFLDIGRLILRKEIKYGIFFDDRSIDKLLIENVAIASIRFY